MLTAVAPTQYRTRAQFAAVRTGRQRGHAVVSQRIGHVPLYPGCRHGRLTKAAARQGTECLRQQSDDTGLARWAGYTYHAQWRLAAP